MEQWRFNQINTQRKQVEGIANLQWAAVAYLGYGRHGTCHERYSGRGAKIVWKKMKFLNLDLASHETIQQQSCIATAPSNNAGRVAPAPSISVS